MPSLQVCFFASRLVVVLLRHMPLIDVCMSIQLHAETILSTSVGTAPWNETIRERLQTKLSVLNGKLVWLCRASA